MSRKPKLEQILMNGRKKWRDESMFLDGKFKMNRKQDAKYTDPSGRTLPCYGSAQYDFDVVIRPGATIIVGNQALKFRVPIKVSAQWSEDMT